MRRLLAIVITLAVSAALAVPASAEGPGPGGTPPPSGTVIGVVYAPDGVTTVPNVMVMACKGSYPCSSSTTSGQYGAFTLSNVPLDMDVVVAYPPWSEPSFFRGSTPIVVTTGPPVIADVRLIAGGRASGTVFEPDGITAVPAGTAVVYQNVFSSPASNETNSTITVAGGTYTTPWLRPGGTLTISAGPSRFGTTVTGSALPLAPGQQQPVNLTLLGGGGWIEGTVRGAGAELAGASVSGTGIPYATTDGSGAYRTLAMPTGNLTVSVRPPYGANFLPASQPLTVGTGTNPLNVDLAVGGILTGSVTGPNGQPLAAGSAQACTSAFQCGSASVSGGTYSMVGLETGTYTLRITMSGTYPWSTPGPSVEQTGISVVAGGTTPGNISFPLDSIAPTISGATDRPASPWGWYGSPVTVTFTCADSQSGIQSCAPWQTLSMEAAAQQATGTAVDWAGNTASATVSAINIDRTPPTVTVNGITNGASYEFGAVPARSCSAGDALSGLVGPCQEIHYGGNPDGTGNFFYSATATDLAANQTTRFVNYTVLAPSDVAAPSVNITVPASSAIYTTGTAVAADYACSDDIAVSTCVGDVPDGSAIDTSSPGAKTFTVTATDTSGRTTSSQVTYTVQTTGSAEVQPGESLVVGAATPEDPVSIGLVTSPDGDPGTVTITVSDSPGVPPLGYGFLHLLVDITAPAITTGAPLEVTFRIDGSLLAAQDPPVTWDMVKMFRDGVPLPTCANSPVPCVWSQLEHEGDAVLVVHTDHASEWTAGFAVPPATPSGFFGPVDNLPVINKMTAGAAVPVKFGLGGYWGLAIFANGSPSSQRVDCASSATDDIEQTTSQGASSLTYDASTERYSYVWKTQKAWANTCRRLTLRFIDGSLKEAIFRFVK